MKNVKLFIFDLDGTLVDAYPAIISSFNYTMEKMELSLQDDLTIRRAVGWGNGNLLRPFVGEERLEEARDIYRKHHHRELKKTTRLLPGAKRLLNKLKRKNYQLAIASNRPEYSSKIILRHLKADEYFDYILCGDKIANPKPAPDILKKILEKFDLSPREAVYVGDMTVDVLTGKRAKVRTVAVVTGSSTKSEVRKLQPFKLIDRLTELAHCIP